ncbi:hypothetical protein HMPREF9278_1347 [Mobiluncus mulieris FB024-16]|nr:hypothetical protein HMPREF9278_1347 [Mobiluncus mulieris FB024-16]
MARSGRVAWFAIQLLLSEGYLAGGVGLGWIGDWLGCPFMRCHPGFQALAGVSPRTPVV